MEPMRAGELISKRLPVALGILLVGVMGGLLWWSPREPQEPVYEGKPEAVPSPQNKLDFC
jgi:hypothetical protein